MLSEVRLTQTLYAEHPDLRGPIEALRRERISQRPDTLASIWGVNEEAAKERAATLVEIGLFEP